MWVRLLCIGAHVEVVIERELFKSSCVTNLFYLLEVGLRVLEYCNIA